MGHPYSLAGETSRTLWGALGFQERPGPAGGQKQPFQEAELK